MKHMIKIELLYSKEKLSQLLLRPIPQLQCKSPLQLTQFNPPLPQNNLENHSKCHMTKLFHTLSPIVLNIKFKTMSIMKPEKQNSELKTDSDPENDFN